MRLERDFEGMAVLGSGARLFDDAPYRSPAPVSAEIARPPVTQLPAAPPSRAPPAARPIAAAQLADYEAADEWWIPRPSRTGIAPAPAIAPVESLWIRQGEIQQEDASLSSGQLGEMLQQAQRHLAAQLASFASALRDRIAALLAR